MGRWLNEFMTQTRPNPLLNAVDYDPLDPEDQPEGVSHSESCSNQCLMERKGIDEIWARQDVLELEWNSTGAFGDGTVRIDESGQLVECYDQNGFDEHGFDASGNDALGRHFSAVPRQDMEA